MFLTVACRGAGSPIHTGTGVPLQQSEKIKMEYALFSRSIDDGSVKDLFGLLNEISSRKDDVYLLLNSRGDNVAAGKRLFNSGP